MTINMLIANIDNSVNNAKNIDNLRGLQNNAPVFCGSIEIKNKKLIERIKNLPETFTTDKQRLLLGATALATQPFIDLNNKKVDEETRTVSCARTLGKIIAGTSTGILVRWLCLKAADKYCKTIETEKKLVELGKKQKIADKISMAEKWLLPKNQENAAYKSIKKYKNTLAGFAALFIMIITNFAIDAPLTVFLTNTFTKKFTQKDSKKPTQNVTQGGKQ